MFFKRFIDYSHKVRISSWRKAAIGTWPLIGDPSIYGSIELDATKALKFIDDLRVKTGKKITLTHFVGKGLAYAYEKNPELNRVIRLGNLYQRKTVDVFFLVATDAEGQDLSGTTVHDANHKSVAEISDELSGNVKKIRTYEDKSYNVMKRTITTLPGISSRFILKAFDFISYSLNIYVPFFGIRRNQFGSVMLTNVGTLGLDETYAPLVPYARTSTIVAVSRVIDKPIVVEGGRIEARPMIKLCCTADHRIIDGVHGAKLANAMREVFAEPGILS